jgi:PAS domain S-box-containing protein
MKLTLVRKAVLLIGIPFALQICIFFWFGHLLETASQAARREYDAKLFYVHSNYATAVVAIQTLSGLGYLLTQDPKCLEEYTNFANSAVLEFKTLRELLKDEPEQIARLERVEKLVADSRNLLGIATDKNRSYKDLSIEKLKDTLREAVKIRREIMLGEYGDLRPTRADLPNERESQRQMIVGTLAFVSVVIFVLTLIFVRGLLSRLSIIHSNTKALADHKALKPPVSGNDEISDVDSSFHEMANRLIESSRKERALVDNATSVLASLDRQQRFIKVSHVAKSSWGYDESELVGKNISNLFPNWTPEDSASLNAIIESGDNKTFDQSLIRANGTEIIVRIDMHWASSEEQFFCVATDVTKEKELEQMKQQLLDTVAHDLRSPMTSIRTTLQLLRTGAMGEIPDAVGKRIERVEDQTNRLIRLINDLLDFERLEAGSITLFLQPEPVDNIVSASIEAVADSASSAAVRFETQTTGIEVTGDSDRLIQVLVNLISNAVKFSPAETAVAISVSQLPLKNGAAVRFEVRDSGPGVPDEFKKKIFERFKMIEGSKAHKKSGSGLGLAICKQIVDLHGGEIGVFNNENGVGATFWFTIPQ